MQVTAAVLRRRSGPFGLETVDLEAPRAGEVLVRVVATGVCHTDTVMRDQDGPAAWSAPAGWATSSSWTPWR